MKIVATPRAGSIRKEFKIFVLLFNREALGRLIESIGSFASSLASPSQANNNSSNNNSLEEDFCNQRNRESRLEDDMEGTGLDNEFVSTRYGVLRVAHFVSGLCQTQQVLGPGAAIINLQARAGQVSQWATRRWRHPLGPLARPARSVGPQGGRLAGGADCKHVCCRRHLLPSPKPEQQPFRAAPLTKFGNAHTERRRSWSRRGRCLDIAHGFNRRQLPVARARSRAICARLALTPGYWGPQLIAPARANYRSPCTNQCFRN